MLTMWATPNVMLGCKIKVGSLNRIFVNYWEFRSNGSCPLTSATPCKQHLSGMMSSTYCILEERPTEMHTHSLGQGWLTACGDKGQSTSACMPASSTHLTEAVSTMFARIQTSSKSNYKHENEFSSMHTPWGRPMMALTIIPGVS